jgi:hypothetical protein
VSQSDSAPVKPRIARRDFATKSILPEGSLRCAIENSRISPWSRAEGGYQTDLPVPAIECSVGLKRVESVANLVSDYEGFQTTVLRYGLLDGQSGSFFSSFHPHVRATLRLTA